MDSQAVKDIASLGNKVVPTTWIASSGQVLPMELAVVLVTTATPTPSPSFLLDFYTVLSSNGCDGLFGIDTIAQKGWSEMKIGDASVVVPSNDGNNGNDYNQDKFIPVAFMFDEEEPKFRVHGKCKKDHNHSSKLK